MWNSRGSTLIAGHDSGYTNDEVIEGDTGASGPAETVECTDIEKGADVGADAQMKKAGSKI